ncbi:histidine kinase [Vibrio sinaloensis DSM 21326]|uniref:Sensory/regulatory protein RpfC n=1 Tax=Vibrio sinaloensis DSM 21326 TaxID=945550 RepID=E8M4B3_PHOS4|nr:ATP-binding protein [Vibrio sinaloensis]EGA71151.1 histidine kinase [Vibrio sinaloensis DSM 21326]
MKKLLNALLPKRAMPPSTADNGIKTSILDLLSEGLIIFDGQPDSHAIFYANPSFVDYYKTPLNQIIGCKVSDFFSRYTETPFIQALLNSQDAHLSIPLNVKIAVDGEDKWLSLHVEVMNQKAQQSKYYVLRQTDVTQIHLVREELRHSNAQLSQLVSSQSRKLHQHDTQIGVMFEQSLDNMLLLDDDLTLIDINDAALKLFGRSKQKIIGLSVSSLLNDFDDQVIKASLATAEMHREVPLDTMLKVKNHIGLSSLSGSVRYITIRNHDKIVLTLRDVHSQHLVQKELRRSQSELERVLRNLNLATQAGGIGIWSWDFTTNELAWDERMYEMYGVDPNNCENNYAMWQERVLDEDIYPAEQALNDARERLSQFNAEFRIQLPSGEIRWIKAAADVLFDHNGENPIGMGGVNIDITKEKNAQENFRHESETALAASEAKSMFLANMSHEIRTPMNGVVGMLSLLSETELNTEQKNMVTTIKDSALTLLHIINDILDFSKIEAGQMSLESVPVELQKLIERTLDVLCLQASNKGIELYLTYDANLPKVIMSDSVRLSQVLLNIIGNAVKFTDSNDDVKGKVWVSATLNDHEIAPYIEIIVEDNGIGMTEEQMKRLFNAFTQADTSTTRLYGGTGLGLSITNSLLELMGGNIKVDSHHGSGSRFYIELPFIPAEDEPHDPVPDYLAGAKLLFVTQDDNIATFSDINVSQYRCKSRVVPTMQKALTVLQYAAKNQASLDAIIIGPDLFHFFHEHPIAKFNSPLLEKQKFIYLTREPGGEVGLVNENSYVMACSPLKPSELFTAIGVIRGKISCSYKEAIESSPLDKQDQESEQGLILVVDDQSTNRDVISRQLDYLGYQCELAVHGQEALQKWKTGNFDLILTDCHMPVMDGYELSKQVRLCERQDKSLGHIPIVAITANALVEASEQCIAAGMDDYLTKPVELKTLSETIKRWMLISPMPNEASASKEQECLIAVEDLQTSQPDPISLKALEQILGTCDQGILAPLLAGYWDSVQEDMSLIDQALSTQQAESLQQIAHAAKGAARSAGAEPLANYFESLQHNALSQDWEQLSETINASHKEVQRLAHYLVNHSYIDNTEVTL